MRNGWQEIYRAWSEALDDYQHLYKADEDLGYVQSWYDDGAGGYDAFVAVDEKEYEFVGSFNSRKKAQEAVEKANNIF